MQGQGLVLQQRQQRQQAERASLRVSAQAATMEAPAKATGKGPREADSQLGTQKPTVSSPPPLPSSFIRTPLHARVHVLTCIFSYHISGSCLVS